MAIDLKPLNKETITKMGYSNHDLWVVKVGDEVLGPFEGESLKHYASEFEDQFAHALASRLDHTDWQPFFSLAFFSASKKNPDAKVEQFWLLKDGQKMGPLSRMDVEKKLEMSILGLNELISADDGHTWNKIYQLDAFAERSFNTEELPSSPAEDTFVRANLLESLNAGSEEKTSAQQGLANLVHLNLKKDNTRLINLDEIDLKSVKETEVARSLRGMVSMFAGFMAIALVTCYLLFKKPNTATVAVPDEVEEEMAPKKEKVVENKDPDIPNFFPTKLVRDRKPASVRQFDRSPLTRPASVHDTKYPEPVIETHEAERYPQNEPDPMNDPVVEADQPRDEGQEPSLVSPKRLPAGREPVDQELSNESLDGSMSDATNNAAGLPPEEQPDRPVMEEATDF